MEYIITNKKGKQVGSKTFKSEFAAKGSLVAVLGEEAKRFKVMKVPQIKQTRTPKIRKQRQRSSLRRFRV